MMGTKERAFGPLPAVTLEELVPPDHFYRHLERTIDLGFVRDVVREAYAHIEFSAHRRDTFSDAPSAGSAVEFATQGVDIRAVKR